MSEETKLVIVTHDGRHHADEVLACWFYQVLHGHDVKIVRSSDHTIQSMADVLLDCGGVYDPKHERIDHHGGCILPNPPYGRVSGYATAGLVWRLYGRKICLLLLQDSKEGPWLEFAAGLSDDDLAEYLEMFVNLLDQEIVAPIDAWDLGVYPERGLSRHLLPFQWILPHLEFETAMAALGRAFIHRLRTIAETAACESNLERDLVENGPCSFWVLGGWLVVKAQDGKRVELRAAKRFANRTMNMPLLGVLSSIRGGSRWGAFLTQPLPYNVKVPTDLEYAAGRRSFFHDQPYRLLDFLRTCIDTKQLPVPAFVVESSSCQPE